MPKSFISNRIIFPTKQSQIKFLQGVKSFKNKSWKEIATEWNVNNRTVTDWKRAKRNMPYELALFLSKELKARLPKGVKILKWSDHLKKAGIKGAKANWLKNGKVGGDEEYRKKCWRKWWKERGKLIPHSVFKPKDILLPKFNRELAEFVGVILGDGGIAEYCVTISLNKSEYLYADFVIDLAKKLFGISAKIHLRKDCAGLNVVLQRKKLVDFLEKIGLPKGSKISRGADIPSWIMDNLKFQKACVRALIDTDGCIFVHTYKSNGKIYQYQKIDFTSACRPLLNSAYKILINLGFSVRISKNGRYLRIESQKDVTRYLKIVGTNNPRYGEKLKNWRRVRAVEYATLLKS